MDKKSKPNLNSNLNSSISKRGKQQPRQPKPKIAIGDIFIGSLFVIYILNLIALIIGIVLYFVYNRKYANETDTYKKNEYKSILDKLDTALTITGIIFISPFMLAFASPRYY